ncbi:phage tail protein [Leptospira interrogans]
MSADLLLPPASTPLERAFAQSTDVHAHTFDAVSSMRGIKIINPPPSFLPFLIYEYGLGELTPYVPNLYELINEGIRWQRVRGTPSAVAKALDWVGYEATIEEFPTRRRHWNWFMLAMDRVRDQEVPDLARIEGVSGLSVPLRSVFWRGFHGYDVRAVDWSHRKWSRALWSTYSGVRIPGGQAKWSYGRTYDLDHALTETELEALGVWIEPTGDSLGWGAFPWPSVPWADPDGTARSVVMLENTEIGPTWVVFKDADGEVIGYRRARAATQVIPHANGVYRVAGTKFAPAVSGATRLYVEALTGFGDGFGATAASAGIILSGEPAPGFASGALWLPPDGLETISPVVAERPVNIEFGRTVRERVRTLIRF